MKKTLSLILIFMMFVFPLAACSAQNEKIEESKEKTEELIEQNATRPEETPVDHITPVKDNNGTYIEDGQSLACLLINDLRIRDNPEGNLIKEKWMGKERNAHATMKCYAYSDSVEKGGYKWLKIDDNRWIGTKPEWIKESFLNENKKLIDPDKRIKLVEGNGWAPCFINDEIDGLGKWLNMDETQKELSVFLKNVMPGVGHGRVKLVDFDSRNPSEEAKHAVFFQLIECGPLMLVNSGDYPNVLKHTEDLYYNSIVVYQEIDENSKEIVAWVSDGKGYTDAELARMSAKSDPMILEEHLNYITEKYYGNVIDFRTTPLSSIYDFENKAYAVPMGGGYGMEDSFPYVYDYEFEGNIITAHVIPLHYMSNLGSGDYELIDTIKEDYKPIKKSEEDNYINNVAPRCEVKIRITDSGNYQLITVKY